MDVAARARILGRCVRGAEMKHISFREGVKRWYRENKKIIHYHFFWYSALWAAAFLFGYINHAGSLFK